MDSDTVSTVAQIFAALGTVSVAILAIWGEGVRAWIAGPKLELELNDAKGDLIPYGDGRKTYYYHLKVRNVRKWSPARSTRIMVVGIQKQSADGAFYPESHIAPLPLRWSHQQFHELSPTVGPDDVCDLGHVDRDADRFQLEVFYWPNNFAGHVKKGESMRVSIVASAHNGEMKHPLELEISWNGKWDPDPSIMERHLVIKKI